MMNARALTSVKPTLLRAPVSSSRRSPGVRQIGSDAILVASNPAPSRPASLTPRTPRAFLTLRTFASSSDTLLEELQKESAQERGSYTQTSDAGSPPEPWSLTEVEGDTLMTLSRSFGNNETVCVDIMVNDQLEKEEEPIYFEDEETGEIEVDVSVDFVVSVLKENSDYELVFECSSDGSFIEIIRVSLEPEDEDEADDEALYTGPIFDELDDTVQDAMYAYLEERGITADLGEYLIKLSTDKEQRMYMDWLDDMSRFLRG